MNIPSTHEFLCIYLDNHISNIIAVGDEYVLNNGYVISIHAIDLPEELPQDIKWAKFYVSFNNYTSVVWNYYESIEYYFSDVGVMSIQRDNTKYTALDKLISARKLYR